MTPLIILILGLLPILGFVIGSKMTRQKSTDGLTRTERKELEARRDFMSDLGAKAAEHAMLGDNFGVIVSDMLREERKRLS
jgi:hypothetical protein